MRKIGLFGGSFNPIHNAHVALARTICRQAGLDEVWFLVSPHNPLKQSGCLADEQDRYSMVELALRNEPQLKACDYEFHLPRPSYTWNTLQHLQQDYPDHTFFLIIGGDNWLVFPKWRNYEDILRNYHIIIYPRENSEINPADLPENVSLVQTPLINITSTMLREKLSRGEDISKYVDPGVLEYIKARNLYSR